MAVEVGTAYVSLVPSARGFGAALDKAMVPAATAAGDQAGAAASGAFGKRLTLGIAAAATAASAGILALGKKAAGMGLKTAAANEQAAISFTKFLGSAEKAAGMLNELKRFAADTPFEFPELQETSRMLLVAGISADKVMPMLRNLGDVVSSTGKGSEGMRRAAIALQQMAASGKIYAEDLNQLRDAGVPVFELLEGATGLARDELMDMIRAGKLGEKELNAVFDALATGKGLERFVGVMELQSRTLLGLWSSLKDNIGQGLAEAMAPGVEAIKAQMPAINAEVKAGLLQVGPVLNEAVSEFIATAAKLMPVVAPVLADLGGLLVDLLSGLAEFLREAGGMFGFLARVLAVEVGGAVTELLPELITLGKALGPLVISGVRLAMIVADAIVPALSAMLHAAEPLVKVLVAGLVKTFERLDTIDTSGVFEAVTNAVVILSEAALPLVDVFLSFVDSVAAELVVMMPDLVTSFVALAVALLPLVHDFAILARDVAPILLSLLRDYLPILIRTAAVLLPLWVAWQSLRALMLDLLLRVLLPFVPLLAHLAEVVLPLLERVLVPLVEGFVKMTMAIGETKFGAILLAGVISGLIALKLLAWIVTAIIPLKTMLGLVQLVTFALAFKTAWQGGEAIANTGSMAQIAAAHLKKFAASAFVAATSEWLLVAAQTALNIVMSPWFLIPAAILAVVAALIILYQDVEWFHKAVDALWDSFQVGIGWIKELLGLLFSGDFTKAGEIVSEMGGRIVDSLANLGNLIKDKVGEWATSALEGLQALGGAIVSFFTDTLFPLIGNALLGLGRILLWYITKAWPYVVTGLVRMYVAVLIWLTTTALPWLISKGIELAGAFVGWIKEAVPAAIQALRDWIAGIGPWFTGTAIPWITERALALKDAFLAWLGEAVPAALETLRGWLSEVGNWITGTAIPAVVGFVGPLVGAFLGWMKETGYKLVLGLLLWPAVIGYVFYTKVLPLALGLGAKLGSALLSFLQELPGRIAGGIESLFANLPGWIATAAVFIAEKAVALGAALWGWVSEAVPTLLEKLGGLLEPIGAWITGTAIPAISKKAGELVGAFTGWLAEVGPQVPAKLGEMLKSIGVWIAEDAIPFLISKGLSLLGTMLLWMIKLPIEALYYLGVLTATIFNWLGQAVLWLVPKAAELGIAFVGWLFELPNRMFRLLGEILKTIVGWIATAVPWIAEKAIQLKDAIVSWIGDAIAASPGMLAGFLVKVGEWILDFVPKLLIKVGELEMALLSWVVNAVVGLPDKLREIESALLKWVTDMGPKIADAAKNLFIGLVNAVIAAVNWIYRVWNDVEITIDAVDILGKTFGPFKLETPNMTEKAYVDSFARGGRPRTTRPSLVGELGPELFWPDAAGTVIPNAALAPGAPGGINVGHLEVSGQDRPTDTAFAIRSELHWLSLLAGAT
jgi:tape measure domain-containing protein